MVHQPATTMPPSHGRFGLGFALPSDSSSVALSASERTRAISCFSLFFLPSFSLCFLLALCFPYTSRAVPLCAQHGGPLRSQAKTRKAMGAMQNARTRIWFLRWGPKKAHKHKDKDFCLQFSNFRICMFLLTLSFPYRFASF